MTMRTLFKIVADAALVMGGIALPVTAGAQMPAPTSKMAVPAGAPQVEWKGPLSPQDIAKFAPRLEYAFSVQLTFADVIATGDTPSGHDRIAVYLADGRITGPMLNGTIVPLSGGDFARERHDGVIDFDARYLLKADDGTIIYLQNSGFRWASPEAMKKMAEQKDVLPSEYYMRVTPRFEVKAGSKYDWLNNHVFVGVGEKTPHGNRIHYYIVR